MSPYRVGAHQHVPEIKQATRRDHAVLHAGPGADAPRHPGHGPPPGRAGDDRGGRRACCAGRTPTSRSCTCCPEGRWPHTAATLGANAVHLQATVDVDAAVVVSCAIDNLGKGAAGQAVQNANLARSAGDAGLTAEGVAP